MGRAASAERAPAAAATRVEDVAAVALATIVLWAGSGDLSAWWSGWPLRANQNAYFLRGLAGAAVGQLSADWTAGTRDPVPIFSLLVRALAGDLPSASFHILYLGVVAAFVLSAVLLRSRLVGRGSGLGEKTLFLAALVLPFSGLGHLLPNRVASLLGATAGGVAGQSILAGYLQPSEAGVLLVVAVTLFAMDRSRAAAGVAALAVAVHPTYALASGFLLTGMGAALILERRWRSAVAASGVWLVLVTPVMAYTLIRFGPTSAATGREAARILALDRLPHHAVPGTILGLGSVVALATVILALVAWHRERRLATCLGITAGSTLLASLIVAWLGRAELYLLFPWRASAFLVPVSYGLVLTAAVAALARFCAASPGRGRFLVAAAGAAVLGLSTVAVARVSRVAETYDVRAVFGHDGYDEYRDPDFLELVHWVRAHSDARDIYAVPIDPAFAFESFRLRTGQPILADWKTHPYRDVEVLEWWRRISQARELYRQLGSCGTTMEAVLDRNSITHVVVAKEILDMQSLRQCLDGRDPLLTPRFENRHFLVLAARPAGSSPQALLARRPRGGDEAR